jgi:hypothetical protein
MAKRKSTTCQRLLIINYYSYGAATSCILRAFSKNIHETLIYILSTRRGVYVIRRTQTADNQFGGSVHCSSWETVLFLFPRSCRWEITFIFLVLTHWNDRPRLDMLLHSGTKNLFKPILTLSNCSFSVKQQSITQKLYFNYLINASLNSAYLVKLKWYPDPLNNKSLSSSLIPWQIPRPPKQQVTVKFIDFMADTQNP